MRISQIQTIDPIFRQVLPVVPTDILNMLQWFVHFTWMPLASNVPALTAAWKEGKSSAAVPQTPTWSGSNAWALGPQKTSNGQSILMSNPHVPWGVSQPVVPGENFQFFEAQLVIGQPNRPTLNASGITIVGIPAILIGFTDDIGWSHTNNTIKNVDLYDIALNGPTKYLFDGRTLRLDQRNDQILVRQADGSFAPMKITIKSSVQGPIVAERNDGHVLAMRVAGLNGASVISEYWARIRARDLDQFKDAIKTLQMPFFNTIFADRKGEIMYLFGGKQPVRKGGDFADYSGVLNGNTSKTFWTRTLPWDSLPKTINPRGGFVQNSNDPPWTSTFPQTIFPSKFPAWISPVLMKFRPQEGALFLLSKKHFTADDVLTGKNNTTMLLAGRVLPDLIAAAKANGNPLAAQAASVLEEWDQTTDANSKGGALFERWYEYYLADPETGRSPIFGHDYPAFDTEWSPGNPLTTPVGLPDPPAAVPALILAATELLQLNFPLDVDWGTFHRVVLVTYDTTFTTPTPVTNEPVSGGPDIFGSLREIESASAPAPYTPESRVAYNGETYVNVVEFSPDGPVKARGLLTYGNASRPGSPHITDQLSVFEDKSLRPILRERADVLGNAVSTEKY